MCTRVILDTLFPPSRELQLVRNATVDYVWENREIQTVEGCVSLLRYSNETVRALVHEAKFHANNDAFRVLGGVFNRYMCEKNLISETVIIPIPLSSARMHGRGYNQVTEIVRCALNELPELTLKTTALKRIRDTRPQTELTREERLRNIDDAFVVTDSNLIEGHHIIVVDDVTTTGTTLARAKAALLPARPSSVTCIALAH